MSVAKFVAWLRIDSGTDTQSRALNECRQGGILLSWKGLVGMKPTKLGADIWSLLRCWEPRVETVNN